MAYSKDDIIDQLKRDILTLSRAPGTPLDEASLSRQFDVSRTPLRDILRQLSGEGFVVIAQNKGAMVAPMDPKSMRNFFMTAPMIYATISRLAAQNARASDIDLSPLFKRISNKPSKRNLGIWLLNDQFHYQIGEY